MEGGPQSKVGKNWETNLQDIVLTNTPHSQALAILNLNFQYFKLRNVTLFSRSTATGNLG
jgi:hypothetical protein